MKDVSLRRCLQIVSLIVATLTVGLSALSQGSAGRITGTITDQTGGAIAGAMVTVTDTQRGVSRTLVSDEAGAYIAPNLTPSTYTVRAEAKGFKALERQNVVVEVNGDIRVDLVLQPGEQTEKITVTESLPLVETTNATLGGTITNQTINELPLNGRNYQNLLTLRPGVQIYPGGGAWTQSTNGLRAHDNVYMVDGILHSDPWLAQSVINAVGFAGDAATILSVDAIQEFRTEQNPRAEYGWKPGSQVNVGLKSGTNNLHGTGFAFGRTDGWDARNYFNPAPQAKEAIALEQFGGTLGGAIKKDKLFWFGDYEGQRYRLDSGWISNAPVTAAGLGGADDNLIAGCQAALAGTGVAPLSAALAGLSTACTPLSNYPNVFPVNSGAAGVAGDLTQFPTGLASTNQSDSGLGKIDYHINDKNTLSGMYFNGRENGVYADSVTEMQPYWRSLLKMDSQAGNVNWTFVPSSSTVNELRWGYARFHEQFLSVDYNVNPTSYGINTGVTNPAYFGFPDIFVKNIGNFELGGGWPKTVGPDTVMQFTDHVSYLRGNHSLKFGADFIRNTSQNNVTSGAKGNLRFDNLTSYFEGTLDRARLTVGDALRNMYNYDSGVFFQDDWRITPRLTLNLGVRYEIETVIHERNGLEGTFDPNLGEIQTNSPYGGDHNNISPRLGLAWDVFGDGKTVVRGGGSLIYETLTYDAFMALGNLVGLRSVPTGALLCSGGATGSCNPATGTIGLAAFNFTGSQLTASSNGWKNNGTSTPVFPAAVIACGDGSTALPSGVTPGQCTASGVDPNLRIPYVTSWNLGVQRAIGNNLSLDVSYVGNHGVKQIQWEDINNPGVGAGYTAAIRATCAATPTAKGACNPDQKAERLARPFASKFPYYSYIDIIGNADSSNYDGLQVTLTSRNYHGLTMVTGYTYAHALDIASDNWGGGSGSGIFTDNNPNLHYGASTFDIRHRLTISPTYNIPGRPGFGQMLQGWSVNSIITLQSGQPWSANDFGNDISGTNEINNTGSVGEYWNFYGNPADFQSVHGLTPDGLPYFAGTSNPACLAQATSNGALAIASLTNFGCYALGGSFLIPPAYGSFGGGARHIWRDSGFRNWDLSVTKAFKFGERLTTEFRAEFFNILNHPEFVNPEGGPAHFQNNDPSTGAGMGCGCNTPDVAATNPVFGSGGNRSIQLGLKLIF